MPWEFLLEKGTRAAADAVNMKCYLVVGFLIHVVFGSLAILVTFVTVDPLALRRRFSPGLPLSNG
jgi:ABC-type protease/lipase transport system fused ATPase/permease subunit